MNIIELFVRRPVLAIIVSLAIVVVGLRAATLLPIQPISADGRAPWSA